MVKIKRTPSKMTEGKKTISVEDVIVSKLKLFDEHGDITDEVLTEIPDGIEFVSFKIVVPCEDED